MHADLPNPNSTTAPAYDRTTLDDQANQLVAAVDDALRASSYRDPSPLPAIGPTPPVPQPGRPPMSQRATDISGITTAIGIASLPVSLGASAIMWTAGQVDPLVIGILLGAPVALALALSRVFKSAKEAAAAAPAEQHHHYNGTVIQDQRSINTQTRGVWASTRNQLPR